MHVEIIRSLLSPLRLWRTMLLMLAVGSAIVTISPDAIAVLCSTSACAFVFSRFERREWIHMPVDAYAADVVTRFSAAFLATWILCGPRAIAVASTSM
jgi:hypothetical protein